MDKKIIDSALKKSSGNEAKELETHVVYAGFYYTANSLLNHEDRLRSLILQGMKKYKIKSVMVTSIFMLRMKLITLEHMEELLHWNAWRNFCTGKEYATKSSNDDLELLFEALRLGKAPSENARTYFLPKLTEKELELVEKKDSHYLQTFSTSTFMLDFTVYTRTFLDDFSRWGIPDHPDVQEAEMKASESNSKFVQGNCYRRTYTIENSFSLNCSKSCSLQ